MANAPYITETSLLVGASYYEEELKTPSSFGFKDKATAAEKFGGMSQQTIRTGCTDGTNPIPCEAYIFNFEVVSGRADDANEGLKLVLTEDLTPGSLVQFTPFSEIIVTPKSHKILIQDFDPITGDVINEYDYVSLIPTTVGADTFYAPVPDATGHTGRTDQVWWNLFKENLNNQILLELKCYV